MNLAGLGRAVAVEQLELAVAESLNDPQRFPVAGGEDARRGGCIRRIVLGRDRSGGEQTSGAEDEADESMHG